MVRIWSDIYREGQIYKERRGCKENRIVVPLHHPSFKGTASQYARISMWLPGQHERDGVKYGHINMASCSQILTMELCHFSSHMELMMHLPAIVTAIIFFPLDKVLEVIVPHSTV
jgi:hypothetical protein